MRSFYNQIHNKGAQLLDAGREDIWARQSLWGLSKLLEFENEVGTKFTIYDSDIGEGKRFIICRCLEDSEIRKKILRDLDRYVNVSFAYPPGPAPKV